MVCIYKNGDKEVWMTADGEYIAYIADKQVGSFTLKSRAIEALGRW